LEGYNDDPALTRVVDRRWYERNKHIFPASGWEEFDPTKEYHKSVRTDGDGNKFFF
jgi:protein FAM50